MLPNNPYLITPNQTKPLKPYLLTPEGAKLLKAQIARLRDKYAKTLEDIQIAKEHGDFSENAELKTAREVKDLTRKTLDELEPILSAHQVSQIPAETNVIRFGATVNLLKVATHKQMTVTIGSRIDVLLIDTGTVISYESGLGKALLGKKISDEINVGDLVYRILSIEYFEHNATLSASSVQ